MTHERTIDELLHMTDQEHFELLDDGTQNDLRLEFLKSFDDEDVERMAFGIIEQVHFDAMLWISSKWSDFLRRADLMSSRFDEIEHNWRVQNGDNDEDAGDAMVGDRFE